MLAKGKGWSLALEEASALCLRDTAGTGVTEVIAVDDERCAFASAVVSPDELTTAEATDVAALVPGDGAAGSNFEGVASDGTGRVFVLQESQDRILVFDPVLGTLETTIALVVAADEPDFGAAWHANTNARGEGLLLLGNGHVLVAKQKEPVRLIEFGPRGDPPSGFAPGGALPAGEAFPLPAAETVEFHVCASWSLDPGTHLESINDLAVNEHGRLFVVSSKSRSVARLDVDLDRGGGRAALTVWPLPGDLFQTDNDKAEGLVFVPELGWLVALDLERVAPNLFEIAGIP